MLVCGCGVTLLAAAAGGGLKSTRQAKGKTMKPKSILELKVLNDDIRLRGELDALKMVAMGRQWPQQVQTALEGADKATKKASKEASSQAGERLLALVKQEAESGASGELSEGACSPGFSYSISRHRQRVLLLHAHNQQRGNWNC